MITHELKTDPEVFEAVWCGRKRFEIRKNDRDFQKDDELLLRETLYSGAEMAAGKPSQFTGRKVSARVYYVLHGPCYGLSEGWCIMSI